MLLARRPVLLLAATRAALACAPSTRTLQTRQDDSLLSQIWTSLEIIASNAITCPSSCAGWLLSSAECGFEIAATFSLDSTMSCLCADIGDDLRDCATCVAADSSSSTEAKSAAADVADLFDQGCSMIGHARSSSAVAASRTSSPAFATSQSGSTTASAVQTALPKVPISLGTDVDGSTYLSTITYSYEAPVQVDSIVSQASASSASAASAYNSSLAAALASSIAASYARAAASYTIGTTVQGQQTITVFTAAGPANTGASDTKRGQHSGGKRYFGRRQDVAGVLAGIAATLHLV